MVLKLQQIAPKPWTVAQSVQVRTKCLLLGAYVDQLARGYVFSSYKTSCDSLGDQNTSRIFYQRSRIKRNNRQTLKLNTILRNVK